VMPGKKLVDLGLTEGARFGLITSTPDDSE
jgi:hypothetical protein